MSSDGASFSLPLTYSGLLDDVVARHRITPDIDGEFFNRSIVRSVFFSGQILINDGYLVNHPAALEQLKNENSLLRTMVKNSFVKVLARQPDAENFSRNPERMAAKNVESFQRLVAQTDWPEIRERLRRWADGLYLYNMVDRWPDIAMHVGFRKLFGRIFDKTLDDLGLGHVGPFDMESFQRRYEQHESFEMAPRTAVEQAVLAMEAAGKIGPDAVVAIMNIANQCYHYNFAMCLSRQRGRPVVADTTIGRAFEDILDLDDVVEADLSKVPVLSIPKGFPTDNGALFDRLLDPTSELSKAKINFLGSIEAIFKRARFLVNDDRSQRLREAAEEYRRHLADYFSRRLGISDWAPRRGAIMSFGIGALGSVVAADEAILAANMVSGNRISSFIHRITRPITRRALSVALNPDAGEAKGLTFTAGDVRPRFASLAFNDDAVRAHVRDLPHMSA